MRGAMHPRAAAEEDGVAAFRRRAGEHELPVEFTGLHLDRQQYGCRLFHCLSINLVENRLPHEDAARTDTSYVTGRAASCDARDELTSRSLSAAADLADCQAIGDGHLVRYVLEGEYRIE